MYEHVAVCYQHTLALYDKYGEGRCGTYQSIPGPSYEEIRHRAFCCWSAAIARGLVIC